ncbi:MAG: insulinase family protein [Acidobacteria bacterium]|nr:insulinase family protein [Acidobacteriota bacterium]
MNVKRTSVWRCAVFVLLLAAPARPQDLKAFEKSVAEFTLANGLHFIVVERHEAPVVSFYTYANVGAVDDPKGRTGLAHMFEHMAFKGTDRIGSKNYPEEKKAMEAVDEVFRRLTAERDKGPRADKAKLGMLEKEFHAAVEKAGSLAESNEFTRVIEESGGVGLNAGTSADYTAYFYSLPSNRIELWFYLESERFLRPVMREFYKERDVVREERRLRTESSPVGKLVEAFLAGAFEAHPYRRPAVGWPSDLENISREDAQEFFKIYYVPANMTMAVVGDVNPRQVRQLAETYFGRLPKRPLPPPVTTVEPEQDGERRMEVESPAQPLVVLGYKKPSELDPDRAVFDVISSVLSGGRTGWFYKELVRDKQIALDAGGFPNFPGDKYPGLFLFYAFPTSGHSVAENETAMYTLIEKLKNEKVDTETLNMVKTKNRAALIRKLEGNSGLAAELATYYASFNDWRQLFYSLDEINKVTADDVERVARKYFSKRDRTVAYLVAPTKDK